MRKPNKIDFDSKSFESCGTKYFIDLGSLCFERYVRFMSMLPSLSTSMTHEDHTRTYLEIKKALLSGNELGVNYVKAANIATNAHDQMANLDPLEFHENRVDIYLDFCALFCVTYGEDCTVYNKSVMDRKKENWKKDMDMLDFFLLASSQLTQYKAKVDES